jgi:hypothetical protein
LEAVGGCRHGGLFLLFLLLFFGFIFVLVFCRRQSALIVFIVYEKQPSSGTSSPHGSLLIGSPI